MDKHICRLQGLSDLLVSIVRNHSLHPILDDISNCPRDVACSAAIVIALQQYLNEAAE